MTTFTPYTDSLKEKEPSGTLVLSVKEPWFSLMIREDDEDRKDFEVRDATRWIKSRLFKKSGLSRNYKYVKIINGYGGHRPYFICDFEGFGVGYSTEHVFHLHSKKINLKVKPEQYVIFLGTIIERKNILNP